MGVFNLDWQGSASLIFGVELKAHSYSFYSDSVN